MLERLRCFLPLFVLAAVPLFVDRTCALGIVYPHRLLFFACAGLMLLVLPGSFPIGGGPRLPAWCAFSVFVVFEVHRAPLMSLGIDCAVSLAAFLACRLYFGTIFSRFPASPVAAMSALAFSAGVTGLVALCQHFGCSPVEMPGYLDAGSGLVALRRQVFGLLGHNMHVSMFLASVLPILAVLAARSFRSATSRVQGQTRSDCGSPVKGASTAEGRNNPWSRSIAGLSTFGALALSAAGLAATYSRAAIVIGTAAVALGLGIYGFLVSRDEAIAWGGDRRRRSAGDGRLPSRASMAILLPALTVVVSMALFFLVNRYPAGLAERFASAADPGERGRFRRSTEWMAAWNMFAGSPWLGCGPASFQARFVEVQARIFRKDEARRRFHSTRWAHNDYLQFLAEFGVSGLCLLVIVVVLEVRAIITGLRQLQDDGGRWQRSASPGVPVQVNVGDACRSVEGRHPGSVVGAGTRQWRIMGIAAGMGALAALAMLAFFYFPVERPETLMVAALAMALLDAAGTFPSRMEDDGRRDNVPGYLRPVLRCLSFLTGICLLAWALYGYVSAVRWAGGMARSNSSLVRQAADGLFRYRYMAARQYGYMAFAEGKLEETRRYLGLAMKAGPMAADVSYLAGCEDALLGPGAAASFIRRWIGLFPLSVELRSNLGAYCMRASLYDEAEHGFREALQLNPRCFPAWKMLVMLLVSRDRRDELDDLLERASVCVPEYVPALRRLAGRTGNP